jgi:hypothetical protein
MPAPGNQRVFGVGGSEFGNWPARKILSDETPGMAEELVNK